MQVKTLGLMDEKLNPLKWGDFQRPATPESVLTTAGPPQIADGGGTGGQNRRPATLKLVN